MDKAITVIWKEEKTGDQYFDESTKTAENEQTEPDEPDR